MKINMIIFNRILILLLYIFAWINILNGGTGLNLALSNEIPFNITYLLNFIVGIIMLFIVEERIIEKKDKENDKND